MNTTYATLALLADQVDDLESARIAVDGRLRSLNGEKGVPSDDPDTEALRVSAEGLTELEEEMIKRLQRAMEEHELGDWVLDKKGVGLKTAARLLGVVGNPIERVDRDTGEVLPRTLAQFRSYCGWGDARVQRRRKGQKANWNADARKRVYLMAEAQIKSRGEYRHVYDEARQKYEDAIHDEECPQCGTKGKPAQPGSDLRDGHKHSRARRAVAKAILKDLWLEARALNSQELVEA